MINERPYATYKRDKRLFPARVIDPPALRFKYVDISEESSDARIERYVEQRREVYYEDWLEYVDEFDS